MNPVLIVQTELGNVYRGTNTGSWTARIDVNGIPIILSKMYYIPTLKLHLISCSRLDKKRVATIISNWQYYLFSRRERNCFAGRIQRWYKVVLFVSYIVRTSSDKTEKLRAGVMRWTQYVTKKLQMDIQSRTDGGDRFRRIWKELWRGVCRNYIPQIWAQW